MLYKRQYWLFILCSLLSVSNLYSSASKVSYPASMVEKRGKLPRKQLGIKKVLTYLIAPVVAIVTVGYVVYAVQYASDEHGGSHGEASGGWGTGEENNDAVLDSDVDSSTDDDEVSNAGAEANSDLRAGGMDEGPLVVENEETESSWTDSDSDSDSDHKRDDHESLTDGEEDVDPNVLPMDAGKWTPYLFSKLYKELGERGERGMKIPLDSCKKRDGEGGDIAELKEDIVDIAMHKTEEGLFACIAGDRYQPANLFIFSITKNKDNGSKEICLLTRVELPEQSVGIKIILFEGDEIWVATDRQVTKYSRDHGEGSTAVDQYTFDTTFNVKENLSLKKLDNGYEECIDTVCITDEYLYGVCDAIQFAAGHAFIDQEKHRPRLFRYERNSSNSLPTTIELKKIELKEGYYYQYLLKPNPENPHEVLVGYYCIRKNLSGYSTASFDVYDLNNSDNVRYIASHLNDPLLGMPTPKGDQVHFFSLCNYKIITKKTFDRGEFAGEPEVTFLSPNFRLTPKKPHALSSNGRYFFYVDREYNRDGKNWYIHCLGIKVSPRVDTTLAVEKTGYLQDSICLIKLSSSEKELIVATQYYIYLYDMRLIKDSIHGRVRERTALEPTSKIKLTKHMTTYYPSAALFASNSQQSLFALIDPCERIGELFLDEEFLQA